MSANQTTNIKAGYEWTKYIAFSIEFDWHLLPGTRSVAYKLGILPSKDFLNIKQLPGTL